VVGPETWVEGDRQQAALAARCHSPADIDQWPGFHLTAIEDFDRSPLLDDVEEPRVTRRVRDVGRRGEVPDLALGDPAAPVADLGLTFRCGGDARAEHHERQHGDRAGNQPGPRIDPPAWHAPSVAITGPV
jgi:hypothetical protein